MTKAHHQALRFLAANLGWQSLCVMGQRAQTLDFLVGKGLVEKNGKAAEYRFSAAVLSAQASSARCADCGKPIPEGQRLCNCDLA
jgi:hypothetical protein